MLRELIVVTLVFALAGICHAEDKISYSSFISQYRHYLGTIRNCKQNGDKLLRDSCIVEAYNFFRPTVRRAIDSHVIQEKNCNRGQQGNFYIQTYKGTVERELPC